MNTAGEIMTDYQFKSIIKMATMIVEQAKDKEAAVKKLKELSDGADKKDSQA